MMNIVNLLDQIAFQRRLVALTGSVTAALMLSHAVYWSHQTRDKDKDNWFCKSQKEWQQETGMTIGQQERARDKLRGTGFWSEKKEGLPARIFYRIDEEALLAGLNGSKKEAAQ
jgi:hypothetical protein